MADNPAPDLTDETAAAPDGDELAQDVLVE